MHNNYQPCLMLSLDRFSLPMSKITKNLSSLFYSCLFQKIFAMVLVCSLSGMLLLSILCFLSIIVSCSCPYLMAQFHANIALCLFGRLFVFLSLLEHGPESPYFTVTELMKHELIQSRQNLHHLQKQHCRQVPRITAHFSEDSF